jgi:hypothetical protein
MVQTPRPRRPALDCSEAVFQAAICRLASWAGYRIMHVPPVHDRRRGWITPTQGDEGWPDLILARDGRILIVELKSMKGAKRFRPGQKEWIEAAGEHGRIWTPADWDTAVKELE